MTLRNTSAPARPERSRGAYVMSPCQRPSTLVYPERPPQAAAEGLGTSEGGSLTR